jgi:hypothetical protein
MQKECRGTIEERAAQEKNGLGGGGRCVRPEDAEWGVEEGLEQHIGCQKGPRVQQQRSLSRRTRTGRITQHAPFNPRRSPHLLKPSGSDKEPIHTR